MAGNMQQMAPGGQFMAQQQHRLGMGPSPGVNTHTAAHIYHAIQNSGPAPPGWQSKVTPNERMKNVQQL